LLYGNKKLNSKRRKARKAGNGSRKEIVGTSRAHHSTAAISALEMGLLTDNISGCWITA
jgi:hypothetical protein